MSSKIAIVFPQSRLQLHFLRLLLFFSRFGFWHNFDMEAGRRGRRRLYWSLKCVKCMHRSLTKPHALT